MMNGQMTLARRMGKTTHCSPLRFKLESLYRQADYASFQYLEDWLIALANHRGARVVVSPCPPANPLRFPSRRELGDEELVVALCQLNALDRPQMLRLAAQLISRAQLDLERIRRLAVLERAEPVLAELSRQALKVDARHPAWKAIHTWFGQRFSLPQPVLHWTRLAEPSLRMGRAHGWNLVK